VGKYLYMPLDFVRCAKIINFIVNDPSLCFWNILESKRRGTQEMGW
jgi:hypothetical protein